MSTNPIETEKSFTSNLITGLRVKYTENPPTKEDVEKTAHQLAEALGYDGDIKVCIEDARRSVDTHMGTGTSLVNKETHHDEDWVSKRNDIKWTYSNAYEKFLRTEGWYPNVIQSLSDASEKILGHLQDPKSENEWDRRGLVIGHVQSGKTANYMSLIAKAADAEYKFIMVIAGIHENLRKQTQERIDEGFVGRSSDPENRINIGVGIDNQYPHPVTLTNVEYDFSKKTAEQSGWRINDFSKPIIIIIKKNVKILEALHNWLEQMNAEGAEKNKQISDVPMLMIDDEADHASINTNKEDIDPTRTNSMIRKILKLFAKSCYVGYTATPFANIFINPEAYDDEVREELFPRDFIYCLDAPSSYFGPEAVFLNNKTNVVIPIKDCEKYIPSSHKKCHRVPELPPSLYRAIDGFIVARAIRNLRGHRNKHCSMMINVSRFIDVQKSVRDFISIYEEKLRNSVKANYAMPEKTALQDLHMQALRKAFLKDYFECEFEWRDVQRELPEVFKNKNLRLYVVNSSKDGDVLDYKKYEKDGHALTALAIGGLSLSRGLTIQGLCISYMYRNTRTYDTLMQMGRWFGYRSGYEDLCKVYLSPNSDGWYAYIADASEELRQQIKIMRRENLSPEKFGLYVKSHPSNLLITARNKMRSGRRIIVKQNFSGRLIESNILPNNATINEKNEDLIKEFWKSEFDGVKKKRKIGWTFENTSVEVMEKFLKRFQTHKFFRDKQKSVIKFLQQINEKYPKCDVLLRSIKNNEESENSYQLGSRIRNIDYFEDDYLETKNRRVGSPGDEEWGFTKEQKEEAKEFAKENSKTKIDKKPSDVHYRKVRNKPLLMIHILDIRCDDKNKKWRVPAFGVSFPFGNYETEVEVVGNLKYNKQTLGTIDNPDEEEDHDA